MKQSSVLLHSKVKKVLDKGSLITLSFSHSSIVHNLDKDPKSKVYHSAFTVHFIVWVFSEKRQVCSSSKWCLHCLLRPREKRREMAYFFFGIRHFLTVHILWREKLQNSLICYQVRKYVLNYEVVPPSQADNFYCSYLSLLLFSPAVSDWITLWITIHYGEYVCQWKWTWRDCPGGNPNKLFNIMCCMSLVVR